MKRKFSFLLCLFLPLLALANRGEVSFKRTEVKEFKVTSGAQFKLTNKYGQIIIHTWNKNEIKATVTITGFGKNHSEAQNIVSEVNINSTATNNSVTLATDYNAKSSSRWFMFSGGKDSKDYVNIDYDVYVPQSLAQAYVENNFGDVLAVDKLTFPAIMKLNYCNFDIRDAEDLQLGINYCNKSKIGNANKVKLNSNYSEVKCAELKSLTVASTYSNIEAETIGMADIKATYDNYKIQNVFSLISKGTYSDFTIGTLQEKLDAKLTYGDLKIEQVTNAFRGGDVKLTFGNARLGVSKRLALRLDLRMTLGDVKVNGLDVKNVQSVKTGTTAVYTALAGGAGEQSPILRVAGTNSDVKLIAE
ncbi:hypothetical protein SAMN05444266_102361 [Chitinophaga jiangningensis]|uniref:Adhesin n=1 Tax=Chitinophaga jiangningensis TaxID=1419482 RepID=A0A1M6YKE8_9BACT|nr:hypothetical protein [Chitinophaga jiangningensis]SHL18728.1 hypothetical protein SAMN05444266_102361 [Chitinophaga jiangningensis]